MSLEYPLANEFYGAHRGYIELVPHENLLKFLERQKTEIIHELTKVTEEQGSFRYADGKWSLKEVLGHISDTERIMSYRLLRFARGDQSALQPFEQDAYVRGANFDALDMPQLLDEFRTTRDATLALIRGIQPEAWLRIGSVSEGKPLSARALAYMIAGHTAHHHLLIMDKYLQ